MIAGAQKDTRYRSFLAAQAGAVIVDVSVDQGGWGATTRLTTRDEPACTVDRVIHHGVADMPGAVGLESTLSSVAAQR